MKRLTLFLSLLVITVGCADKKAEKFNSLPFPQLTIPSLYADNQQTAMEYAVMNYWNAFTDTLRHYPSDSLLSSGVEKKEVERFFADYARLLGMVHYDVAAKSVRHLYDRIVLVEKADSSSNVFETLTSLVQKYLYDPNSPLRYEDVYYHFVKKLSEYQGYGPQLRAVYANEARLCALNRCGTTATDFKFSDKKGRIFNLHGIKADFTLLFFSNPGCEACMDIIRTLDSNPVINSMIDSRKLAVANVYIDEDIASWYDYMAVYPAKWYNGYDHNLQVRRDELYNVRAIPSVYLLDKDKSVIMKDALTEDVLSFLMAQNQVEHNK